MTDGGTVPDPSQLALFDLGPPAAEPERAPDPAPVPPPPPAAAVSAASVTTTNTAHPIAAAMCKRGFRRRRSDMPQCALHGQAKS